MRRPQWRRRNGSIGTKNQPAVGRGGCAIQDGAQSAQLWRRGAACSPRGLMPSWPPRPSHAADRLFPSVADEGRSLSSSPLGAVAPTAPNCLPGRANGEEGARRYPTAPAFAGGPSTGAGHEIRQRVLVYAVLNVRLVASHILRTPQDSSCFLRGDQFILQRRVRQLGECRTNCQYDWSTQRLARGDICRWHSC
jgi:hypothetical protein